MSEGLGVNAVRIADTALRNHCGFETMLRLPGQAVSGSTGEELGLGAPQFQDVSLGPGVWRKIGLDTALLIGATGVSLLVGSTGYSSAEAMFEEAVGVVIEAILYTISESKPVVSGGEPCGYRLSVIVPVKS